MVSIDKPNLMMTSSTGNIFRVTGLLCGEFTGHRWIPRTKVSDAKLWCFCNLCLNKWLSKPSRFTSFVTLTLNYQGHMLVCHIIKMVGPSDINLKRYYLVVRYIWYIASTLIFYIVCTYESELEFCRIAPWPFIHRLMQRNLQSGRRDCGRTAGSCF